MKTLHGHCLCKTVMFTVPAPKSFDVCHCNDCRRWHGSSPVGIDATLVTIVSDASTLKWYRSSEGAERGFCINCGSSLFYRLIRNRANWSVYIGALTNIPKDIPLGNQYFLEQKPNCYALARPNNGTNR